MEHSHTFFLVASHGIQAVGSTSGETISFNQSYLINLLVAPGHTPGMAGKAPRGNIYVREVSIETSLSGTELLTTRPNPLVNILTPVTLFLELSPFHTLD